MQRETNIVAGIVAATTAAVGLVILAPTIVRAWTGVAFAAARARETTTAPQNARARRLSARIAKKATKRAAHALVA